jgi:putative hydrolase of the HAD superfamily
MGVTLYIFDMGGVVSRNCDVIPDILRYLDVTEEDFLTFAGDNLGKFFNGKVSADEFWAQFSSRYGQEVKEELFGKFFHPSIDPEVIALIRQLKERSRVVCGTNTFDPHYDVHSSRGDYAIFDAVFASNKIGLAKPDPKFYRYILKHEGVHPEDSFFVDDTEVNVLSAERMGINAHLFRDSKSLGLQIKNHQRPSGAFPP